MVWFQNVFRFSRGGKLCSHNIMCLVTQLCPTICSPMDCSLPGSSVHGDSPSMNTGVGCRALLQGIFPTQGLNPGLPHCRWILFCLSLQGRNSSYLSQEKMLYEEEESEGFYLKIAGSLGSFFFFFFFFNWRIIALHCWFGFCQTIRSVIIFYIYRACMLSHISHV